MVFSEKVECIIIYIDSYIKINRNTTSYNQHLSKLKTVIFRDARKYPYLHVQCHFVILKMFLEEVTALSSKCTLCLKYQQTFLLVKVDHFFFDYLLLRLIIVLIYAHKNLMLKMQNLTLATKCYRNVIKCIYSATMIVLKQEKIMF